MDMEITYDVMAFTRQMQQHSLIDLSVVASSARSNGMMRKTGKLPLRGQASSNMMQMGGLGTFNDPDPKTVVHIIFCMHTEVHTRALSSPRNDDGKYEAWEYETD